MIVKLPDVGSAGYVADIPAHDLPETPLAWSSITNMGFRNGLAERVEGYAAGFDTTPSETSYGLFHATQINGTPYVIGAADGKVYTYTSSTEVDITGAVTVAATADTKWTGGLLTGILVLNESINAPVFITVETLGSGTLAALTNWPSSTLCKVLRPFKYFLVAGGMTEGAGVFPFKVRWSTSAVPGALPASWVAAVDNDAGSVDLSADDGPIIDMLDFGDQLAIYRQSGITMMRYTGGSEVMTFNRVPSAAGGGLVGNNCVVDVAGIGHVAMSSSDLYVFDGSVTRSLIDKKVRQWLAANLSSSTSKRSFVIHHASKSEVWACFPETGAAACTKAIIWNYADNSIGIRDLPNCTAGIHAVVQESATPTWDAASGGWNTASESWLEFDAVSAARKTVLASTANKLYVVGNSTDAAGSALIGQLERTGISFGDAQRLKYVKSIWPRFDASVGQQIEVTVGQQMDVGEPVSWGTTRTFTVGTTRKIDVNRTGRFLALRLRSPSGAPWRIRSIDVDLEVKGMW